YGKAETGWSLRLTDDTYLALSGGVSVVDSYYGRSGLNDFYGRTSLTYNINKTISVTPFLAWSIEFEEEDGDELILG
ncbi:MAG: hypothetical protein GWO24_09160, partial [Akkermansiaceae bacterium]|nr:hypothetical protein [Akkermansiaceae bacterium]